MHAHKPIGAGGLDFEPLGRGGQPNVPGLHKRGWDKSQVWAKYMPETTAT